jgi:hypothetical protein
MGVLGSRVNRAFSASSERHCLGFVSSRWTSQENGIAPHQIIERDEFSKPQTDMPVGIATGKARLSRRDAGRQS